MLRILSIDGGGVRGIIPAVVLAEIEHRTGKPVASLFDLIVGTSAGGILALGLAKPGVDGRPQYSASALVGLYTEHGESIFGHPRLAPIRLLRPKYSATGLRRVLETYLEGAKLSDALTAVTAVAYETELQAPWFFRSWRAKSFPDYDFLMVDVALSTAAAPTYFPPHRLTSLNGVETFTTVDGGLYANNPALCALVEARQSSDPSDQLLVSIGTGDVFGDIVTYETARRWGIARWARPAIDMAFTGGSAAVEFQLGHLLEGRYWRFQAEIHSESGSRLDDASPKNLRALEVAGRRLVLDQTKELHEVCALLTS